MTERPDPKAIFQPVYGCNPDTDELEESENVSEETERKFLTLSWWTLHVGWKDVGERVRRGVEEVFEEYVVARGLSCSIA